MLNSDFKEIQEIELTETTIEFCRDKIMGEAYEHRTIN